MSDLTDRCRKRLKQIAETQDAGYWAKLYAEDVVALLAEVDRLDQALDEQHAAELARSPYE